MAVAVRVLFWGDHCSMVPVAPQRNLSYTGKKGERCRPSPWLGMSSRQA
jgi:hypothetical protein